MSEYTLQSQFTFILKETNCQDRWTQNCRFRSRLPLRPLPPLSPSLHGHVSCTSPASGRSHQPKVGLLVDKRGGPEGALGLPNSTEPLLHGGLRQPNCSMCNTYRCTLIRYFNNDRFRTELTLGCLTRSSPLPGSRQP